MKTFRINWSSSTSSMNFKNISGNIKVNEQGDYNANINESNVDFFTDEHHENDNENNVKTTNEFNLQKMLHHFNV